ncbi:MAG: DUF362 domain-containing protein [Thermoproteota archaeon]
MERITGLRRNASLFLKQFIMKLCTKTYVIGFAILLWFIYRTGTKPSRITYPCQRAALLSSYNLLILPAIGFLSSIFGRLKPIRLLINPTRVKRIFRIIIITLTALTILCVSVLTYLYVRDLKSPGQQATYKTTVAIVKVGDRSLYEALEEAINYVGRIENIVPEGVKVLVKPNIVRGAPTPVTTSPDIVEALVNMVKKRNPTVVWIAEGSGEGSTMRNFRTLGYFEVAERTGAELVDLNSGELAELPVPSGGHVYSSFKFNKIVAEADVFISVPVMKTHYISVVSLGMKNLIGIAPASVYSTSWANKWALHLEAQKKNDNYLGGVITDLCSAKRIDLVVIDGRVAMEGNGPYYGSPVNMDILIVGRDPVATDAVAAHIMGFDPNKIPSIKLGNERDLGISDLREIEIRGESIDEVFRPFQSAPGHEGFKLSLIDAPSSYAKSSLITLTCIFLVSTITFELTYRKLFLHSLGIHNKLKHK